MRDRERHDDPGRRRKVTKGSAASWREAGRTGGGRLPGRCGRTGADGPLVHCDGSVARTALVGFERRRSGGSSNGTTHKQPFCARRGLWNR